MAKGWIGKAAKGIAKHGTAGSFTAYCKRQGFAGVTCECIAKARKAGGSLAQKANFANNAGKKGC